METNDRTRWLHGESCRRIDSTNACMCYKHGMKISPKQPTNRSTNQPNTKLWETNTLPLRLWFKQGTRPPPHASKKSRWVMKKLSSRLFDISSRKSLYSARTCSKEQRSSSQPFQSGEMVPVEYCAPMDSESTYTPAVSRTTLKTCSLRRRS